MTIFKPTSALTPDDLNERTKNIFEQVRGIKVRIGYSKDNNYIAWIKDKGEYHINLTRPNIPAIEEYTATNHELAHYAFKSPIQHTHKEIKKMVAKYPEEIRESMFRYYASVFNFIEDQRIESNLGSIYLGTNNRFIRARKALGDMVFKSNKPVDDPLNALQAVRFGKSYLVQADELKPAIDAINNAEYTGRWGGWILTKKYIENVVDPYLATLDPSKFPHIPAGMRISIGQGKGRWLTKDQLKQLKEALKRGDVIFEESDHNEFDEGDDGEKPDYDEEDKDILRQLREAGEKERNKLKKDLEKVSREYTKRPTTDYGITKINRPTEKFKINTVLATTMNRMFRKVQSRKKKSVGDTGDEVSIPHVIQRMSKGYGDVMLKLKKQSDLTVLVSIDGSGSMDSDEMIGLARYTVATLYASISGIKNINFQAIVWAGGNGKDIGVTDIGKLRDCEMVTCGSNYYSTPTPMAIDYSTRRLLEMGGKKKVLFVITDGEPSYSGYSSQYLIDASKQAVVDAERMGIRVMGFFVGNSETSMREIFKHRYVRCPTMREAITILTKKFQELVIQQVRR